VSLACIRGCAIARRHLTDCEHPDDGQCRGCLPRQADFGALCIACHYRLVRTLREIPHVWFLLAGHLAPGSTARSGDIICRTKGMPPAPLNLAVLDSWSRSTTSPSVGPASTPRNTTSSAPPTASSTSRTHLASVECSEWIADAWDELTGLVSHAHALVPWRPEAVKLGAPCPQCHCQALVLYGGDDWVTCQECGYAVAVRPLGAGHREATAVSEPYCTTTGRGSSSTSSGSGGRSDFLDWRREPASHCMGLRGTAHGNDG
jgi:hypothetical protein